MIVRPRGMSINGKQAQVTLSRDNRATVGDPNLPFMVLGNFVDGGALDKRRRYR